MPTWTSESDLNDPQDEAGVAHENVSNTDHTDAGEVRQGYRYEGLPSTFYGSSLVGWWPLHRTFDDTIDLSGNGNDGTVNGPTRGVTGRGGLQAFRFDGTDDYVDIPNGILGTSDSFTVSCWFKTNDATVQQQIVSLKGDLLTMLGVGRNSNEAFAFVGGNYIHFGNVQNDIWYHAAYTYTEGGTHRFYFDGDEKTTTTGNIESDNETNALGIDGFDLSSLPFDGSITGVRIYNSVLSGSDIQTLYEWGSGDYARPPDDTDGGVSYWNLNEDPGSTSTASDSWGSNDGTINGASQANPAIRGTGLSFDGTDDYVSLPTDTLSGGTDLVQSVWFKDDGSDNWILELRDNYRSILNVGRASSGELGIRWGDTTATDYGFGFSPTTGVWYHACVVYNNTEGTLNAYVNGDHQKEITGVSTAAHGGNISISSSNTPWGGDIDEVRLYEGVTLSPEEIHDLYQHGTFGRDLRAHTVRA